MGDVRHEIGLEPRHLALAPHEAIRGHEARRDHDQQQAEGGTEERDLPTRRRPGRHPRRLVEGHPPGRQLVADRDGDDAVGARERNPAVHGALVAVDHGHNARALHGAHRPGEDVPAEDVEVP